MAETKSFFGSMKGLLFEDTPSPKNQPAKTEAVVSTPTSISFVPAPSVEIVEKLMVKVLVNVSAYQKFYDAVVPLKQFIPEESAQYKAAFGIIGKGYSVEQITSSIDSVHIAALSKESADFKVQFNIQLENELNPKKAELSGLKEKLLKLEEEKKACEVRLQEIHTEQGSVSVMTRDLDQFLSSKQAELDQFKVQFEESVNVVKSRLEEASAKVKRYLST